jgi:hypothetical protein
LIFAASCSGFNATTSCAVEQLGLAMMPLLDRVQRVRVHFGHDQRHFAVHAPLRRIVDHDRALRSNARRPFLGHARACRHQADIRAVKVVIVERLDLQRPVAERNIRAGGTRGRQRHDFACGEFALRKNAQHFPSDIAGRADDGDFISHKFRSFREFVAPRQEQILRGRAAI